VATVEELLVLPPAGAAAGLGTSASSSSSLLSLSSSNLSNHSRLKYIFVVWIRIRKAGNIFYFLFILVLNLAFRHPNSTVAHPYSIGIYFKPFNFIISTCTN
jgi:hypothetical protein